MMSACNLWHNWLEIILFETILVHDCVADELLIMTFVTKLTMAVAGCVGSRSLNRWHVFSVVLPILRATNPNSLKNKQFYINIFGV